MAAASAPWKERKTLQPAACRQSTGFHLAPDIRPNTIHAGYVAATLEIYAESPFDAPRAGVRGTEMQSIEGQMRIPLCAWACLVCSRAMECVCAPNEPPRVVVPGKGPCGGSS